MKMNLNALILVFWSISFVYHAFMLEGQWSHFFWGAVAFWGVGQALKRVNFEDQSLEIE